LATVVDEVKHIDHWKVSRAEIERELKQGKRPKEMVCLGCAAKIPLVETVYPALEEIKEELKIFPQLRFKPREDAYFFDSDGSAVRLKRGIYSVKALVEGKPEVINQIQTDIREFKPSGVVLLISLTAAPTQDAFKQAMLSYYRAAAPALSPLAPLTVGKGHSIQISKSADQTYLVADYIKAQNYSNLAMFAAASLGTANVLVRAHFFHSTHIHPKLHARLVSFNLESLVSSTYHLYHQATIWLIFLWLTTGFLVLSTILGITYAQISIIAFVISANFSWVLAVDIEREIELADSQ